MLNRKRAITYVVMLLVAVVFLSSSYAYCPPSEDICVDNQTISDNYLAQHNTPERANVSVWFFYASWCPHCHRVLMSGVLDELPDYVNVTKYLVDKDPKAHALFSEVVSRYGIVAGVPTAVIFTTDPFNGTILQGDTPIISEIRNVTELAMKNQEKVYGGVTNVERNVFADLAFLIGTAAADSINPCIMAVLLIMLGTLASIKEYKKMRDFGIIYVASIYFTYLGIGVLLTLGAVYIVNQLSLFASEIATATKIVVAAILVFAGVVNIKDYFWWGKGITFNINEEHKKKVIELAKKASIPAIISIAVLITVVEFPCSGIMYLGAIFYFVSTGMNPLQLFGYLLIYNLIFVLPPVGMLVIALGGKKASEIASNLGLKKANEILMENKEKFRLIMGVVLIALAILILVT